MARSHSKRNPGGSKKKTGKNDSSQPVMIADVDDGKPLPPPPDPNSVRLAELSSLLTLWGSHMRCVCPSGYDGPDVTSSLHIPLTRPTNTHQAAVTRIPSHQVSCPVSPLAHGNYLDHNEVDDHEVPHAPKHRTRHIARV
ncbi:hypothetical protein C8J57DRAFT_1222757 [Mycena rebaudengoi]|nr:hypothetical protein C8J57DRAFT_1222757 [Mycena rebaudengoi]